MADDEEKGGSPLRAVVGLGVIVALIVGVLFVMHQLQHASSLQDCVASGRTNCAPIESGHG
jgi:heme/copper-type cytochrome/quinol oxidase subunit 4